MSCSSPIPIPLSVAARFSSRSPAADLDGTTGSAGPAPDQRLNQAATPPTASASSSLWPLPAVVAGSVLTATATSANSTSEFSGNVTVGFHPADLALIKTVSNATLTSVIPSPYTNPLNLGPANSRPASWSRINPLWPALSTPSQGTYDSTTGT